jgi:hypothetical protein
MDNHPVKSEKKMFAKWNLSYAPETKLLTDERTDVPTIGVYVLFL